MRFLDWTSLCADARTRSDTMEETTPRRRDDLFGCSSSSSSSSSSSFARPRVAGATAPRRHPLLKIAELYLVLPLDIGRVLLDEFLRPYRRCGVDVDSIATTRCAREMFVNYCASSGSAKVSIRKERSGRRRRRGKRKDRNLGANFSFRREKDEKRTTENKDVMAILSNGTTIAKGRNTNLARGERAKKIPIDILSTSEAGRKEEQRGGVVVEFLGGDDENEDKENEDDTKATATAFWRRTLTTPPTSPIKKPISTTSNVNTPEKASESKSDNHRPKKKIPKRQRRKLQQKQEETERAREQLRSIQLHEEKKLNNFIRKSRVNCIKSKLLAKKKWSIYDSQRRRKRSIDAIVRERGTSLFP